LNALTQGFASLGYVDGKTIVLEHRFPNEIPERFASQATELVALKVDVLVAVTQIAALAAQQATAIIPTVFILVPDPIGIKLVNTLSRPGGNITGLTTITHDLSAKRLALFKEAIPRLRRVALLVNVNDQYGTKRTIDEYNTAANALGFEVQPVEVRAINDIEEAFKKIVESRLEGVVLGGGGLFYQTRVLLAKYAMENSLPLMVSNREALEAGGLITYGPSFTSIFRRAAVYVDKIIRGEKPAELPVEQPSTFELLINLKTAKAIGLTISEGFLLRSDGIIE
jgi:putative ABC transport system substrate-binding protein